ncbi:MAG: cation:proton antiporter [Planctomycetes bacterium]|nr:cation:proton antiporter [Planctomycetota bacterium]
MSNFDLSIQYFLQLAVILAACRLVGWAARWIGQPQVVGEMIAGVVLGPSVLGLLGERPFGLPLPDLQKALFSEPVLKTVLYCMAQVGLVLYMFLVGAEFNAGLLREKGRTAAAVSASGMFVPFVLGAILAFLLFERLPLFNPAASKAEAALFMGAAMCITAFPMLARIIVERGIAGTRLGTLALAAGSMDDAAAWCVLAIVLASFNANPAIAMTAIAGGIAYAVVAIVVIRPLLRPLAAAVEARGELTPRVFSFVLMLLLAAAWLTDYVRIYAVFGAFILGAVMPRGRLCRELQQKIEPLTTNFLLPLFFVYSGLNTRIDLVSTGALWGAAAVVLVAACAGKYVACALAARLSGESLRDSLAIGALMNARGLMELIILNIGLERGLITHELFTIMVLMAIVTTLMATPLFNWVYGRFAIPHITDDAPILVR